MTPRKQRLTGLILAALGCGLSIAPTVLTAVTRLQVQSPAPEVEFWPLPGLVLGESAASGVLGLAATVSQVSSKHYWLLWIPPGLLISLAVLTFASIGILLLPAGIALAISASIVTGPRGGAVKGPAMMLGSGVANLALLVAILLSVTRIGLGGTA